MSIAVATLCSNGVIGFQSSAASEASGAWEECIGDIFCFRLSTEEGIFKLSRYLATVRRATTMSAFRRRSTMPSSESTSAGSSPSIICRMRWRTASAEWASPEFGGGDGGGEEILHLEQAARGLDELVRGGARHRRLVDSDRLADRFQVERFQPRHAFDQEGVLAPHDFTRDIENRARSLFEALGQPVRRLKLGRDVLLVFLPFRSAPDGGGIGFVDQHARQRLAVQLDAPCPVGRGGHVDVGNGGGRRAGRRTPGPASVRAA